jgi:hypothetical protein
MDASRILKECLETELLNCSINITRVAEDATDAKENGTISINGVNSLL